MQISRTPGIADPSAEQVLFSPVLLDRLAYLGEGERIDEAALSGSLCGCFQLRGLGFGFFTRGTRPRPEAGAKHHRSGAETALRDAGAEIRDHSLFHVFGLLPVSIFRAVFGMSPYKRQERLGKQLLRHPASFTVPWTALVGAEYGSPLATGSHVFDPLLLSVDQDGGPGTRVLFIEREHEAAAPALPVARLFEQRARFEELSVALAVLAASLDGTGNGSEPFTFVQLYHLGRDWFGDGRSAALDALIGELGTDLTAERVTTDAAEWLARYPIAAALDRRVSLSDDLVAAQPPKDGWPFPAAVVHATLAPWPEAL